MLRKIGKNRNLTPCTTRQSRHHYTSKIKTYPHASHFGPTIATNVTIVLEKSQNQTLVVFMLEKCHTTR